MDPLVASSRAPEDDSDETVRILFLSQRVPYPPNRGDKITTWRLIDRMRRSHEVTCVAFAHDRNDVLAARELDAMGIPTLTVRYRDRWKRITSTPLLLGNKPLTLGVYGSRRLQRIVDRLMPGTDLAYAYSSSMGAFLEKHRDKPRIMHFGELDSDKWSQYAERAEFPMNAVYRREARTLLEFERRIANSFSENVLCTPLEQKIFQERIPGASSRVLRNGVDLAYYKPSDSGPWLDHIAFTGMMDYLPNVDACQFFVREVFPIIRREFANAKFTIVGAKPSPEIRQLGKTLGVTITGYVPDTRKVLRTAAVSVAPLRIARGIQNKVLEALAMGIPVVSTTSAAQGVDGVPGRDYLVADEAGPMAEAVCKLLRDPEEAREQGMRGRRFVEDTYDWEVVFEPLDQMLVDCAAKRAATA
jgi:polysaccharide biosynthesis protein PslH